ncbi:MAG: Enterococcus phage phiFL3A [Cyanobacteriota bacterium]
MGIFLGNLNPDSTFTSDIGSLTRLATSAPFARYLAEAIFERSAFIRSGVMQTDARLSATTGSRIEAPFFDPLNTVEEQIRSDDSWGTSGAGHFTSQKVTASTQYATITYRGFMYSADDLSRYQTGEDPLMHMRNQLAADIDRKVTAKLLSQLTGLVGPGGVLAATNALDVSVTTGADETNYLTASNITAAKYLLGERAASVTTIAMHPKVAAYMETVGALTFSTDALSTGGNIQWGGGGIGLTSTQVGYMMGLRVIVDEQLPIRGATGEQERFVCYLFGNGVVATGNQFPLRIETERNIASLQDAVAVHYSNVMHVMGTSWGSAGDNPTNAQLATAGNWGLAYSEPRLIPLVELVCNSPFGGLVP